MIRAAIVGLGWWGQNLVNSVRQSNALRFTTAHTRNRSSAEDFCAKAELAWVNTLDAILADPDIDAVVFATPHSQHSEQIVRSAAAGKHLFMEKPLSLSLHDALRAVRSAEAAGIVLGVGFNRRFHPSMRHLRSALAAGRLGSPVTVVAEQTALHGISLRMDAWRVQVTESPAGAMTAIGVHLVDGMIDLMGPIRQVYAQVARRAAPHSDDTTDILLRFENGASGHIFSSTAAAPHYRMAVYGTAGLGEIMGHAMAKFSFTPVADNGAFGIGSTELVETPDFNMLTAELEEFALAIEENRLFATPLEQVLHGVAVFEAVVQSLEEKKPIMVGSEAAVL